MDGRDPRGDLERRVEVFPPNATSEDIDALAAKVRGWPEVFRATKVTEEEAFAQFKDEFKDQPELYEDLDQNVFPASVQMQLKHPDTSFAVSENSSRKDSRRTT